MNRIVCKRCGESGRLICPCREYRCTAEEIPDSWDTTKVVFATDPNKAAQRYVQQAFETGDGEVTVYVHDPATQLNQAFRVTFEYAFSAYVEESPLPPALAEKCPVCGMPLKHHCCPLPTCARFGQNTRQVVPAIISRQEALW